MKKLVSVVLTLAMIISMFATASASSIADLITSTDDPYLRVELPVEVLARKSGSAEYANSLSLFDGFSESVGVDYKATLNMENVRNLFDRDFIKVGLKNDAQALAEFNNGLVETTVKVTVTYPGATVDNTKGSLENNNTIFSEKERRAVGANSVEITFVNKDGLKVSELEANKDAYLADLTFKLEGADAAKYADEGNYNTEVTLTGDTALKFSSKTIKVAYSGEGSYVLSATKSHMLAVVPAIPATCTQTGKEEGVICTTHNSYNCGAKGTKEPTVVYPMLPHSTKFIEGVSASCIGEGVIAHYVCLMCKKTFEDSAATKPLATVKIAKSPHSFSHLDAIAATCTENGLTAGDICTVCGYATSRKVVQATGHTPVDIPAKAPDCTTEGATAGKKCSVCNAILVAPIKIVALGHKFDNNWTVTKEPSETSTGTKERTCIVCGVEKEVVEIPKLQHICVADPKAAIIQQEPTCTETGLKQEYCACGKKVGEPEVIPAKGHDAESISGKAATCTEPGIAAHYACKNCQKLFRDAECTKPLDSAEIPVDKFNHGTANIRKLPAIAPTCDKAGLTEGEKCIKCNTVIKSQEKVAKLHDSISNFEKVNAVEPTCENKGTIEHLHCSICGKDYTLDAKTELSDYTIPAKGHNWGTILIDANDGEFDSTEVAEGKGHRECTNTPGETHIKKVDIAKKEHVHNEKCEETILLPTCTEKGKKCMRWTCCGEIDKNASGADTNGIIEIPATGHSFVLVSVAATCFTSGIKEHNYCTVCKKRFDKDTGAEITDSTSLVTDRREHEFEVDHENANFTFYKCKHCGEQVKIPKENKAKVKNPVGVMDEKDKIKEDRAQENDPTKKVEVDSQINIEQRTISKQLEDKIHEDDKAQQKKVVLEITVEKTTTTTENVGSGDTVVDTETELVPETKDLLEIEIPIPADMQQMKDFIVYRRHKNPDGTESIDEIKVAPNSDNERIVISPDKTKVTIYVKKFSEYAVVGFDTIVNPPEVIPTGSSSSSTTYTIKLNTNGGLTLGSIKVKRGALAVLPTPERDGYTFAGWFTDSALTNKFDPATPIKANMTLYAKWIGTEECKGTQEDNCPCLKFTDLDPTMWYHRGVDFVLSRGMMNGVATTEFAPDLNVTRAMLVAVLWRAEGRPTAGDVSFTDLEDGQYYVDAVKWAAENGVVNGYSESVFAPNDAITREQFAAIMYRYATFKKYDVSVGESTNILSYTDYEDISEYAVSAMQYTAGSGLMTGRTKSTLNPKATATRAEMATILYRFLTK